jgi:hypothetical protein
MRGTLSLIAVVLVLPACGGCLSMPNVVHPGSESHQQYWARWYEPYPENESGPPVVGARPREYRNEIAEPDRAKPREGEPVPFPYRVLPPPPTAQPPIITAPPAIYSPPCVQPVSP